jgi:hypothetical protein
VLAFPVAGTKAGFPESCCRAEADGDFAIPRASGPREGGAALAAPVQEPNSALVDMKARLPGIAPRQSCPAILEPIIRSPAGRAEV